MSSITGLKTGNFTSVNNSGEIRLGTEINPGTAGQVIISAGADEPAVWGTAAGHIANPLTMGTNLSLASGNPSYDGTVAETINATVPTFTGGNGIDITGTTISTDNDGTTINNTGGTGTQNQVLKVPNALTAGTNISFSAGTTYDGSAAITINSSAPTFSAGKGIDITAGTISTDNDGTTINNTGGTGAQNQVLKVPNTLTINGTTYDGSVARAFTLPVAPIPNADLQNSSLTLGNTTCTLGTTTSTIEELELDACLGITMDGANIDLDGGDVVGIDDLTFQSSAGASAMTGNPSAGNPTTMTNFDLSSSTNIIHPPNVFDVAGDLRMSIEMGNFYPNDDSSFFQIGVEDDLSTKIHGTLKVLTSSLEVCGYFIIPANYTATALRVDVVGSTGASVSRTLTAESIITYGTVGFTSLVSTTTGSEQTLTTSMVGASDRIMLITIKTTSTTDHIRGGYIKLTR
tara:strand:- start:161 stop:1543 length:1383 start_codon:yes stop_codon:yes gene_type:complete